MISRRWLFALALAAAQAALLASVAWDKADTVDEDNYIAAAGLWWAHGERRYNEEGPLLPKLGFALALRLADPTLAQTPPDPIKAARYLLWAHPLPELRRNLLAARLATVFVMAIGGLLLWAAARRFGEGAALATHALWCTSPSILAHGSLATLDGWAAALLATVLLAVVRFVERPGVLRAVVVGIAIGLAGACKVTTLGVLPVVAVVVAWACRRERSRSWLGRAFVTGGVLGLALVVTLWILYGFSFGLISTDRISAAIGGPVRTFGPLPFPEWIEGVLRQRALGFQGHRNYLFGVVQRTGWWWFYLAVLAFKTTLGAQALAVARLAAWVKRPPSRETLVMDAALAAYPVLLLIVLSLGNTQSGLRYLLPIFPFAFLGLGRAVPDLQAAFGRFGRGVAAAAIVLAAAGSLSLHPHYLMFFNLWAGGPTGGPRYLIQSEDWGQDQRRLGQWQAAHHLAEINYTYYTGEPLAWGIVAKEPPCTPERGVYALHAIEVHRPRRIEPGCLDWLTVEPPDDRIGYSIYIYFVNRERLDRLAAERNRPDPFWRSGPPP